MFFRKQEDITTLDDAVLTQQYKATHESKYISELYTRYAHLVLGLCIKYLKNEHKAQDAVMSIFEQLISKLKSHDVDFFKSWLYTLSKNHCLQILRKEQNIQEKGNAYTVFAKENMKSEESLHLNDEENNEQWINLMEKTLPLLKETQQKCIKLFYLESKSYAEITAITGYSLKEVKSHIQNGKRNLKIKMLEANGGK